MHIKKGKEWRSLQLGACSIVNFPRSDVFKCVEEGHFPNSQPMWPVLVKAGHSGKRRTSYTKGPGLGER